VYHESLVYRLCLPYEAGTFPEGGRKNDAAARDAGAPRSTMASFSEPMQLVHRSADLRVGGTGLAWEERGGAGGGAGRIHGGEYSHEFCVGAGHRQCGCFVHRLKEDEFQCSFSFHHAIMDGWSEASLITELVQNMKGGLAGESLAVRRLE